MILLVLLLIGLHDLVGWLVGWLIDWIIIWWIVEKIIQDKLLMIAIC